MASEELHRDTRIACFSAVKPMLSVEAAWDILYKAVDADEPFVKQALCDVSTLDFTHELRRRYAPIVIRLAKDEHMDVKCRALQALAAWAIYSPDAGSALVNSSTNMSARESEWKAAVQSLVQWGDTESLLKATRALLDHGDESDDKGSDLPAVRRLKTLCDSLQRGPHAAASYAVATLVAEHEDFVPHAARLRAARIDYDDPGKALEDLRDLVRLLSHRPLMALRLRLEILDHCAISPAGMDTIARGLIDDGGTVAGIFAVGLIAREGGKEKWSEGRREMLLELRRHPDADVRDEARRARMQ
ncbi:hypothetical protein CC85DRAFT_284559 [Cutaneotrichosporon oleaginosum]|uniref:ARM repeat-containing protein n=1 Tax=Cutaneotrichosporon oleaginosum TaxID=879819 RepID=A0A0J0XQQ6_9TREE|nr:uncharacterized protein CC85DRAFT_284559 [Cutaneotrichosporon oleaginosum]KLT43413.1 hypothetical protein CC85DRAFT_284559 [Cutaneotrichosporon oleaginosum]TXT05373.1 hypothetical protein COLE_06693 [Cutaneotrichosporon oleaginosum]